MRETAKKRKLEYNAVLYFLHGAAQTGCNQNRKKEQEGHCTTEEEDKYMSV